MKPISISLLFWNIKGKLNVLDELTKIDQTPIPAQPDILLVSELLKPEKKTGKADRETKIRKYFDTTQYDIVGINVSQYFSLVCAVHSKLKDRRLQHQQIKLDKQEIDALKRFNLHDFSNNKRLLSMKFSHFLLFVIHLPSKLKYDEKSQLSYAIEVSRWVRYLEAKYPTFPSIVVGDFNMNPFDAGMILPIGFNAPYDYDSICKKSINIETGFRYPYFYNPMWQLLGLANKPYISENTFGTYEYKGTKNFTSLKWNFLDQVLIRPQLIPNFVGLKVQKEINTDFVKSDHHPVYFEIVLPTDHKQTLI